MIEEQIVEAVEQARKPKDNLIKLSSGVVLRGKQANPFTMIDVMAAHPHPKPPMWKNPTMGRWMENTDDPDYRERVKSWEAENSSATLTAMILLGTELVKVPEGIARPEDDSWLDKYSLLELPMRPDSPDWRYLKWVQFVAIKDIQKDMDRIKEVVGRLSGISESLVESAETFPGSE